MVVRRKGRKAPPSDSAPSRTDTASGQPAANSWRAPDARSSFPQPTRGVLPAIPSITRPKTTIPSTEAGYWGRGCSWGRWRRWTGPLVTPARSPWEARPGRVSEGVGMKGWSVGVSGAAWGCSRESAPQSTPTPAQFSLQRQRIPWGRHREHGGLLLQADQPPPPPRRPPPTWTFATTRP